jgi:tRNA threonylcarbamoyladenosine biosynthesis protein TsaE
MIYNLANIESIAQQIIEAANGRNIWIFEGEMGAGKTTLIKAICKELGINGNVQSPTFSIVNQYTSAAGETIYHFDFYRLKNELEALDFGVEEYFDSGHICLLEWAEKLKTILPQNYFKIKISLTNENGSARKLYF